MKKNKKSIAAPKKRSIFEEKANVRIDLGCGENKQPGTIGVDFREMKGVDIVQNLTIFPWRAIPTEVADVVYSSHLLEHINPDSPDPRLAGLLDLLLQKKLSTQAEVDAQIGDYKFLGGFIRFMDEVWRTLKPGGQFISTFPFGGSPGFIQDPTHVNQISPTTLGYFDPLSRVDGTGPYYGLYPIYAPKPWKILRCFYSESSGFMEVALEKRVIDKSYNVSSSNGMSK